MYDLVGVGLRVVACRFIADEGELDDVVQAFWLDIDARCRKYSNGQNGYGYLVRAMQYHCKMWLRKARRRPQPLHDAVAEIGDYSPPAEGATERQVALRASFDKAQARMADKERAVFVLWCYGEQTVREIARNLHLSPAAVNRAKQKATEILRQTLREDGWDEA